MYIYAARVDIFPNRFSGHVLNLRKLHLCVCDSVVIAVLVPYIDLMVAMTGSLVGAFLCFTLPAIIHAVSLTWDDDVSGAVAAKSASTSVAEKETGQISRNSQVSWAPLGKSTAITVDVVLIVVGTVATTIGSYATLSSIIREKLKA